MVYDAATENASFGRAAGAMAAPGRLVNLILTERVANPVAVVDEVDKAGTAQSGKGRSFDLTAALLPLLEPLSARNWTYFELPFDMGWINWAPTSHNWRLLAFLRGGMMAAAPRAAMASWHLRVPQAPSAVTPQVWRDLIE